ncbi:TIGR04438 family Trp-rich protein [Xylophilus ampelinus]|uniref:Small Trp-rich protein n=1 Tax=Xylophilus ampelinus TaxID=54067 RepID=A0A318SMH4_9BURK|nr:TIGR04438 family Trp-rich protein [Xylophilus ampelinus]MCS4509921.1 TIGR04438 family Trp-rich protein [Xylophilus ampelinus]PYE78529.1 small Trp-rich protein [Xylophilus ampelinus]
MYFLGLGLVLLAMKWLELGPVVGWSWWIVLAPFALAVAWWAWADSSGLTKRREMDKMDKRKTDRINKQCDALGLDTKKRR